MPLYLLPLFVPLALLVARQRQAEGRPLPRLRWIAAWVVLLLGVKLALGFWPTHKDASAWARTIRERATGPVTEVVFVEDMARYGLNLHLKAGVEKISLTPMPGARFNPQFDEDLAAELAERESGVVYITKQAQWPQVAERIRAQGYVIEPLGAPYRERILFTVMPQE
jgi:hypothetical protein